MGWGEMRLGLPTKQGEEPALQTDFNAMRREIEQGGRDSALIRGYLDVARHEGLSGEDTYTLLAYQSLKMLEDYYQRTLQFWRLMPNPQGVVKDSSEFTGQP